MAEARRIRHRRRGGRRRRRRRPAASPTARPAPDCRTRRRRARRRPRRAVRARGPLPDLRRRDRLPPSPPRRRRPGRRRHRPDAGQGRGPRPRRRIGQRQDDDRPGHRQAHPPDRRPDRLRRAPTSARCGARRSCAATGAGSSSSSRTRTRRSIRSRRSATSWPSRSSSTTSGRPPSARPRSWPRSRPPGCDRPSDFAARYPARAVRRPAPAGGHRRRPGHGPGGHRRGRAGLDARRLDPDRAAPADARPPQGARPDLPVHHPRPVAGLGHRRPDRGHVPRQDHGDRPGRGGHPLAAQPVHARRSCRSRRRPTRPTPGRARSRTILEGETPDAAHVPSGCRFHPRCPVAFDRCRVEEPPLFDLGGGQSAACWLVEDDRVGAASPSPATTATAGTVPVAAVPTAPAVPLRIPAPEVPDDRPPPSPRLRSPTCSAPRPRRPSPSSWPSATTPAGDPSPASGARTNASATSSRPSGAASPAASG